MKRYIILLFVFTLLLCFLAGCSKGEFDGSRISNDNEFIITYLILNGTETHQMGLEKGNTIDVKIESISGKVDLIVTDSEGNELYKGNNADSGSFKLIVPTTDTYIFAVSGDKAKGSVSFKII